MIPQQSGAHRIRSQRYAVHAIWPALMLATLWVGCGGAENVTLTVGAETDMTFALTCTGASYDFCENTGFFAITQYQPLHLVSSEPGSSSDTQDLEIVIDDNTSTTASACIKKSLSTVECADMGTMTLSDVPTGHPTTLPNGKLHLHFPSGGVVDSVFYAG